MEDSPIFTSVERDLDVTYDGLALTDGPSEAPMSRKTPSDSDDSRKQDATPESETSDGKRR